METSLSSGIHSVWEKVHSQAGLPFPTTVAELSALGVTRYRVDYVARNMIAYVGSTADVAPIPNHHSEDTEPGVVSWDSTKLIQAIRSTQAGEGNYWDFSKAAVQAGVTDYTAYITGMKVVYSGVNGDSHTEWFPGAKQD